MFFMDQQERQGLTTEENTKETRRVSVTVDRRDYIALRSALMLKGITISEWLREQVREHIDKQAAQMQQQI